MCVKYLVVFIAAHYIGIILIYNNVFSGVHSQLHIILALFWFTTTTNYDFMLLKED